MNHRQHDPSSLGKGGRILSTLVGGGLFLYLIKKPSIVSLVAGVLGTEFLYRGLAGRPLYPLPGRRSANKTKAIELSRTLTINRPRQEVYGYWRTLENLPKFMEHVKSVQTLGGDRSHWHVQISPHLALEWDAQITTDRKGEEIAWHSLPGAEIENWGRVEFRDAPLADATEITVTLHYLPPAGAAGRAFEVLHQTVTVRQMKEDMRRFKQMLEAGERPTIEGQPSGA